MKIWLTITIGIVVLLAIAVSILLIPNEAVPQGPQSASFYQTGSLGIIETPLELVDTSRPTDENGEFPGTDRRLLAGFLWQPASNEAGPYPLIIYSHGFMSSVEEARYYAEFLVPKGYVVAAVNYPLTNGAAPGGANVRDVRNQPGDVSFIIDTLLERSEQPNDSLSRNVDHDRVAVAGLSLGGLTTILSGFHGEWRDPRIKAVAAIAGLTAAFDETFFSSTDTPLLMIAGSSDAIVPYAANARPLPEKDDNATLVTLDKASHTAFAVQAEPMARWVTHPDEIVCPMLLENVNRNRDESDLLFQPDKTLGIVLPAPEATPCHMTEFERAMRPAEQLMLTRLALYAFLESVFSKDDITREESRTFLREGFPEENKSVSVQVSAR